MQQWNNNNAKDESPTVLRIAASNPTRFMAVIMAKTLAKSGFQLDYVYVAAEPFSNHQEDSGIIALVH